ncbi:hypothetical protein IWW50_001712 [Coemansia erecta]|nr:hypothetical protein IWW50_001712 [Coemansia erecta]
MKWGALEKRYWEDLHDFTRDAFKMLNKLDGWENYSEYASTLYKHLETTITNAYDSKCIVLVDEYDIPLVHIRNEPWEGPARKAYLNLLNGIFKDNSDLQAGVLVGVHNINLCDIGSGPNNIFKLPLTVLNPAYETNTVNPYYEFGELFAFTKPEVEALVQRVQLQNSWVRGYSLDQIVAKIVEWYDGYCFGLFTGKFNPVAVAKFLSSLCSSPLDRAAQCFWEETGNQSLVKRIALTNRAITMSLATEVLAAYARDPASGKVKQGGVWQRPTAEDPTQNPVIVVSIAESYIDESATRMSISQLVSLFVYTGYLTIRSGGHVGIPNGEMRRMWEGLLKLTASGTEDVTERDNQWSQLHMDVYNGNVRGLLADMSFVMSMMPNSANNYLECVYGDIFRTYVLVKFFERFRNRSGGALPDFLSEMQSGIGRSDLVITIPPTDQLLESLVVIIEFKRIEASMVNTPGYPLKRARAGLEQIIEKRYASSRGIFQRRLDIGIAMGCGQVVMRQRMWRRADGQQGSTDRSANMDLNPERHVRETVQHWDERLYNADESGWQDEFGWITTQLPSDYRLVLSD